MFTKTVTVEVPFRDPVQIQKYRWPFGRTYPSSSKIQSVTEEVVYKDYKTGELKKKLETRMIHSSDQDIYQYAADKEFADTLTNIFKITMAVLAISTLVGTGAFLQSRFKWIG